MLAEAEPKPRRRQNELAGGALVACHSLGKVISPPADPVCTRAGGLTASSPRYSCLANWDSRARCPAAGLELVDPAEPEGTVYQSNHH